ncbi:hypothetical protein BDV40DRAFT_215812 [Aspergillus tamarii]|uniref:Uncharacterized protein n=1 Tax=Aspergillus tamarii TaxID=41984 RepID=A0A5N6UP85_ASPTM|nr:hypothetical protein BDV40DRAFT_215812 [Aspergillus tamarii]
MLTLVHLLIFHPFLFGLGLRLAFGLGVLVKMMRATPIATAPSLFSISKLVTIDPIPRTTANLQIHLPLYIVSQLCNVWWQQLITHTKALWPAIIGQSRKLCPLSPQ